MSGDVDYLLKVVTPDIRSYDAVYKKLIKVAELSDVSSSFSMECIKYTTALPVDYVGMKCAQGNGFRASLLLRVSVTTHL